jgi:hypothetical protein
MANFFNFSPDLFYPFSDLPEKDAAPTTASGKLHPKFHPTGIIRHPFRKILQTSE